MKDIKYELKLINLFGLKIINCNNSNYYIIVDENNKQVGNIKKERHDENEIYYHTKLETNNIIYNKKRNFNNTYDNIDFCYEFDIKNEDKTIDHVQLAIGRAPYITIWRENYIIVDFSINYERLFLRYSSKTDNYNIEETTIVEINSENENEIHKGKEYNYALSYSNNENKKETKTFDLIIKNNCYTNNSNKLKIIAQTLENDTIITSSETIVDGTISSAIATHQMGIDSFKHFRYLINKIFPFKNEVISSLLENRKIIEEPFALFFDEYKRKINLSEYHEFYEITDNMILGIKEIEDDNNNIYAYASIIYNDNVVYNFIPIITSSPNNCVTGYYRWNKNYIFMCLDDGTIGQVFDIKNKTHIVDNYIKNKLYKENIKLNNLLNSYLKRNILI